MPCECLATNVNKERETNLDMSFLYLFQPPPLFLLLLNPFLPLGQQLPFILLLLPQLLLLKQLLSPKSLRALLVLLLQPQEITTQSGLPRHIHNGAAGGRGAQVAAASEERLQFPSP